MKMKVRVSNLQAAIQKHIAADKLRFNRETAEFAKLNSIARERYIKNLTEYLASVKQGAQHLSNYDLSARLEHGCKFKSDPKPPETHTDLLVKLDLAEDQILVVDDHSDYMKFLSGKCVCR